MESIKYPVKIVGIEYYLPPNVEDLDHLKTMNPDWDIEKIYSKTGISSRHICNEEENCLEMAIKSSHKLLSSCSIQASEVDALIFVTQSPVYFLPTTACLLQHKLGLRTDIIAFDMNLGCSGFIYALQAASALISTRSIRNALIVCSDTYSKFINVADRTNRPIFSDGASSILLSYSDSHCLHSFNLGTDGSGAQNLITKDGAAGSNYLGKPILHMNGANLFMFTMSRIPKLIEKTLADSKIEKNEIESYFLHQASKIVLDGIESNAKLPAGSLPRNYQTIGNTVSSSIPILMKDSGFFSNKPKNSLLCGFGVGYSWGSCIYSQGTKI